MGVRHALLFASIVSLLLAPTATAADVTIQIDLKGKRIEGMPLAWDESTVELLGRDGRVWRFAPNDAKRSRRVADRFISYSASEMRGQLQGEFGAGFEVSGTGHFLVVHPRGQKDDWAARFEELYRSFVHYFHVRGFRLDEPPFPLVAVIFPSRGEYAEYARLFETPVPAEVVGFYSGTSNRIVMYDATQLGRSAQANLETLIHEAAHQTAFNTGIHNRQVPPPRWVCEGLGMLFEASGVWNSRQHTRQADRINRYRFERYQQYRPRRTKTALAEFVLSDQQFDQDPDAAYAEAWSLTFFLSETRPRQYYEYLKLTSNPTSGSTADPNRRLSDFVKAFGKDMNLLEAHYQRFVSQLR